MPTSNMKPLYRHILEAFCQSIEELSLHGKPSTEEITDFTEDDFEGAQCKQNSVLKNSIGYILSNYPALKSLKLEHMLLKPVISSLANSLPKRHLEELRIDGCCVHPWILPQISEHIRSVKDMYLFAINWMLSVDLDLLPGYKIDMPLTAFDTIHLDTFGMFGLCHLFTIKTSLEVTRWKIDMFEETATFLTEDEFEQSDLTESGACEIMIFCESYKAILMNGKVITCSK